MAHQNVLKIGIAGFGGAGTAHYRYFGSMQGCKVVSAYDPSPKTHERVRNLYPQLYLTDDFDDFLNSDINVVSICSPDRTHADLMSRSILAGKHTICEKPLADSIAGCHQILRAVKNSPGCVTAVQHQMRFLKVHRKMREIVSSGELGNIGYIEGYYVHNLTKRAYQYHPWRFEDNATPLIYSGCHFVDLLRWILDDEVEEVMGMANNICFPDYPESDLNVTLLRFRSGVIGKVVTAFGAARPQDHSVRIYGSRKSIENNLLFSNDGQFEVFHRPRLFNQRGGRPNLRSWIIGQMFERLGKRGGGKHGVSSYPLRVYEHEDACFNSLADFTDAIRQSRQPQCRVIDAAQTVAICIAGIEANRSGRPICVTEYLDEITKEEYSVNAAEG